MRRLLAPLLFSLLSTSAGVPAQKPAQRSARTPAQDAAAEHHSLPAKDVAELSAFALTMDIVSRLFQATHAATEAARTDPSIKVSFEGDANAESPSVDQLAAKLTTSPKLVVLLAVYGFTPRQFSTGSLSLIQTGLAMLALQSGKTLGEVSRVLPVNPANIEFLKNHHDEITALQTKYPTS